MATSETCPRCGTALKPGPGDCPVCYGRSRQARPRRDPALDFTADEPPPRKRPREGPPRSRGLVVTGAALFLLLGTVLTGYCFAVTFLNRPEEPLIVSG